MSAAISAMGLSKRFRKVQVLNGLNLDVPEGSVFALIGPNGAGKTTTIKILMNFIQATSGSAHVLGVYSRNIRPENLTEIGYVSENQEMPEWMTVGNLLAYLKPFYPNWDDARAGELVRRFELPLDRPLGRLSRGMRMKAALASSLAYRPRLLVLDEPFSGLDPVMREDLIAGILESASEATVFISSHDLADIESFASHIGYLSNGRLMFSEEMTSLAARFREIEITLHTSPVLPSEDVWPSNWLAPQSSHVMVRFVETQFDSERTPSQIGEVFGEPRQISVNPVPLRTIFLALARSRPKNK
jgi:ABC-2 type transport system ATP-binding protein